MIENMNRDLKAKLEQADEEYEAIMRDEQNRATYLLATFVVDPLDPEQSIAELEKIGEEKLRQIVKWLSEVEESNKS